MTSTFSYRIARASLALFFLSAIFLSGCKEDDGDPQAPTAPQGSNNTDFMSGVEVSCDLVGIVRDINGNPLGGIEIRVKNQTTLSDPNGIWHIENLMLDKNRAFVAAVSPEYFHASEIIRPKEGGSISVYHHLIPLEIDGSFNSDIGGTVSTTEGAQVDIPANGVVFEDGSDYAGEVRVALHFLDTETPEYRDMLPGDLTAFDENGEFGALVSYSMAGIELRSPSGEELNLAPSASATITLPLAADMMGAAEPTIPLWYFNEEQGYWQEEGEAVLEGNAYVGNVSHFSFWNADVFENTVYLSGCVNSGYSGAPYAYTKVRVDVIGSGFYPGQDYTDANGKYGGLVPENSELIVSFYNTCDDLVHSESVTTGQSNVVLDVIINDSADDYVSIEGQLTDCELAELTDAQLYIVYGDIFLLAPIVAADGSFEVIESNCFLDEVSLIFIREGNATTEYFVLNPDNSAHNLGDLNLCGGEQLDGFFVFDLDGQSFYLDEVDYSVSFDGGNQVETVEAEFQNGTEFYRASITRNGNFSGVWNTDESFEFEIQIIDSNVSDLVDAFNQQGQETVTITVTQEAPALGTYLEAEFQGSVFMQENFTDNPTIFPNIPVSGSFRVLREW